ncbi:MAG: PIG-L family deacetylase [Candidatus Omnitrophota bacterium]
MAPHPDDEAIGVGGVLQQALKAGAAVRICLFTNGENNEFSFIVYEHRLVLKPKEFLRLGEMRRQESLDAMRILGVRSEDVVSLGYPDYGTMEIFLKYWGDTKPFRSMLSRVKKVPYQEALSPGAAYVGENVLTDIEQVIESFKPTKIFVSHPADVNRDHRALYLFTQVALWDLQTQGKINPPDIFPYIIHVPGWPLPRGYHPELPLAVPSGFEKKGVNWIQQPLDAIETGKKFDVILEYPSQIKYAPRYLVTFARKDEIFGNFSPIILSRQMASDAELIWEDTGLYTPPRSRVKSAETEHFSQLAYARQGNFLVIRVVLKRTMDKDLGMSVSLMGYNCKVPYAQMPKINLIVGLNGFHVKDKKRTIYSGDVIFLDKGKEMIFKVPLSLLGNPDYILSCAKTAVYDLTLDETAWRILQLP